MALIGKDIHKAKVLLEHGELVAIPTETVYGLAGNALNVEAITKIFKVKDRPYFDPLIVHIPDFASALSLVEEMPTKAKQLADHFWPGPLTLLLKKKTIIPDLVTSGLDTVGVRCPDHPMTIELLKCLNFPLAAPSANPFGFISPTQAIHVNDQLGEKIEYILDGGSCSVGLESTIIGFDTGSPVIYRLGGLSVEKIESVVGKVTVQLHSASNPKAPGQLLSHYAPTKKLILGNLQELLRSYGTNNVGVLSFRSYKDDVTLENQRVLSTSGDLDIAAQQLFTNLRELDRLTIQLILAEEVPDHGLGRAINDRLRRAATPVSN